MRELEKRPGWLSVEVGGDEVVEELVVEVVIVLRYERKGRCKKGGYVVKWKVSEFCLREW